MVEVFLGLKIPLHLKDPVDNLQCYLPIRPPQIPFTCEVDEV